MSEVFINETSRALMIEWMNERESIRLKREAGQSKPWTQNPILKSFRFCNVRREDDRTSKFIIENYCLNANLTLRNKIANTLVARMYNNLETMRRIGLPRDFTVEPSEDELKRLDDELSGTTFLTNAYMAVNHQMMGGYYAKVTGESNGNLPNGNPALFRPSNLLRYTYELLDNATIDQLICMCFAGNENGGCEQEVYKLLRKLHGMGDFMAYQHFVDMTYIPDLKLSEDVFAISGAGCIMGLQLLTAEELVNEYRSKNNIPSFKFKSGIKSTKDADAMLVYLRDNFHDLFPEWKYDWTPTLMCLENVMCETHKYIKTTLGWGKPRNGFDGKSTATSLFD